MQSKNGNLCSIHSWKCLFNPFENTFNPSDIPRTSAANPSWLGEGKLVLITMAKAEVDAFDLESDLPKVFEVFSSKSRNYLAKCWREKPSGSRKCMHWQMNCIIATLLQNHISSKTDWVKDRPARTANVVFVATSHYYSLQVTLFPLQSCLLEIYLFCRIWSEAF